jgi:hypothetical protein
MLSFLKLVAVVVFASAPSFAAKKAPLIDKATSLKYMAQALAYAADNISKLPTVSINGSIQEDYGSDMDALQILAQINLKLATTSKVGIVETKTSANGVECRKQAATKIMCQWVTYGEHENGASLDSGTVDLEIKKDQYGTVEVVPVKIDRGSAG